MREETGILKGIDGSPDAEHVAEAIPEAHDVGTGEHSGAAFPAVNSEKMTVAIGVDDAVEQVGGISQLEVRPIFQIVRRHFITARRTPAP